MDGLHGRRGGVVRCRRSNGIGGHDHLRCPLSAMVVNDCTAEWVVITGTQHVKTTDNSSLAGLKYQIESNLTGVKGITASGARYVMNDQTSDMQHAEFDPFGEAGQVTMENTTIMNRQGENGALIAGDDFRLPVVAHLTVANGVAQPDKTDLQADCR